MHCFASSPTSRRLPRSGTYKRSPSDTIATKGHAMLSCFAAGAATTRSCLFGRGVTVRALRRVSDVVSAIDQESTQPKRKLGVNEELHAAVSGSTRRTPDASAPYSSAAKRSSCSRSA